MAWEQRTTAPTYRNQYYMEYGYEIPNTSRVGLNECIVANDDLHSCLPNCVGYCWGRWYEASGTRPRLSRADAKLWYGYTEDGYTRSQVPNVGAIICWGVDEEHSSEGGHTAVVEAIDYTNRLILTSNSAWKKNGIIGDYEYFFLETVPFDTWKRPVSFADKYVFQGFILYPDSPVPPKPDRKKLPLIYYTRLL